MKVSKISVRPLIWQMLFIFVGTSWLLAPSLNHYLSDRTTLISQYEVGGQPYSLLFRAADLIAGLLLVGVAAHYYKKQRRLPMVLLLVVGIGMTIDPIFVTSCRVSRLACTETFSISFLVHAIESAISGMALLALSAYDARVRHKLVSISYVIFQVTYGLVLLSRFADREHFNTVAQYVYQCLSIIWLAWYVRDYLFNDLTIKYAARWKVVVRYGVSIWVLANGLLAILLSLSNIRLLGKAQDLYFSRDTAWLAQHGVIVGVIMLYLSRYLLRGERRARQIVLAIIGVEALKYAVISPNWGLALLYSFSFSLLFVMVDEFSRGSIPLTWKMRLKDVAYLLAALLIACLLVVIVLDRDSRVSRIADHSYRHFTYYALHSDKVRITHKESALLANMTTAFLFASSGAILWMLFKPYNLPRQDSDDSPRVTALLERYADSTEDYFKLWPHDKQYYWGNANTGFIAYKIAGSVAFALADPISDPQDKTTLVEQFLGWARTRRITVCFLPISAASLDLYTKLNRVQIGASALVTIDDFISETIEEKWWRWKNNRAIKQGYEYAASQPPHTPAFLKELRQISDDWLGTTNHQERGFALGYFDEAYLQQCMVHYLKNQAGEIVAFSNQLPNFATHTTATVDLMRYRADATDAMPYLLARIIKSLHTDGYTYFDLGFVPFAETKGSLQAIAQAVSAHRFSAKGLQQFKNKFKPDWQEVYLAYDGDLADLALIALRTEAVMKKK